MRKEHPNMETTMTTRIIEDMNETRAATMRRVLADEYLLNLLPEPDREELIRLYMENLQRWEDRKNG